MRLDKQHIAASMLVVLFAASAGADCPLQRRPVRTATDADAAQVRPIPLPAQIESLHMIPASRPLPQDRRIAPAETTIYSVIATLVAYRLTPESDIQLVLADDARRTIIATIPAVACAAGSRFQPQIADARASFERRYAPTDEWQEVRRAVEVQGVGFFDFFQGQRGIAPNGLGLHPVTAIDFTPAVRPKAPPPPVRRRGVGSGVNRGCTRPSLTINASRRTACAGEPVTISWQASDSAASVTIDGIGTSLPPSGTRVVTSGASAAYSGRATTACGVGDESVAVVLLTPAATASLSGPNSVNSGSTTTLNVFISGAASWALTSSLGNSIHPPFGTANGGVTYSAGRTGTDTVTLVATGGGCGSITKTHTILVTDPPNQGLRCCDGTRSPTCFSCSNKRGCCSGHGGVCGCP